MKQRLNDWWAENEPDKCLIYCNGLQEQCIFIRDTIMINLFIGIATDIYKMREYSQERNEIYNKFHPSVIGTHTSKSVKSSTL